MRLAAATMDRRIARGNIAAAFGRKPFERYRREEPVEVRGADVKGTDLEILRRKRELLKAMTPEQALEVIEFRRNLNLFEAVEIAKRENLLLVPNFIIERILTETKAEIPWTRTGTLIIYQKPDAPFGALVTYQGIAFSVPEKYQGMTNCALAVEHPDFEILDLGANKHELRMADESTIHLIEKFPGKHGWHLLHAETGIPHGRQAEQKSPEGRRLWRVKDSYVGLLVRYYVYDGGGPRVDAYFQASGRFGVALF